MAGRDGGEEIERERLAVRHYRTRNIRLTQRDSKREETLAFTAGQSLSQNKPNNTFILAIHIVYHHGTRNCYHDNGTLHTKVGLIDGCPTRCSHLFAK